MDTFTKTQVKQACALAASHADERVFVSLPSGGGTRGKVGNYARDSAASRDFPLESEQPENLYVGDAFLLQNGMGCTTHVRQVLDEAQIRGLLRDDFDSRRGFVEACSGSWGASSTWVDRHASWVLGKAKVSASGVESPDPADRTRAERDFFAAFEPLLGDFPIVDVYGLAQIDAFEAYLAKAPGVRAVDVTKAYRKVGAAVCAMTGDAVPEPGYERSALLVFTPHGDFLLRFHYHPCASSPLALQLRWLANEMDALFLRRTRVRPTALLASPVQWAPGMSGADWSSLAILGEAKGVFARRVDETQAEQVVRLLEDAALPRRLASACWHLHNSMFSPIAVF